MPAHQMNAGNNNDRPFQLKSAFFTLSAAHQDFPARSEALGGVKSARENFILLFTSPATACEHRDASRQIHTKTTRMAA